MGPTMATVAKGAQVRATPASKSPISVIRPAAITKGYASTLTMRRTPLTPRHP